MQVSSGLPLPAENIPSALLSEPGRRAEPWLVEDEEFPSELPTHYDWALQPASQSNSKGIKRFVVVLLTILLIAVSAFVAHKMFNLSPSVLASPASLAQ
jgi:hypothetical protein